MSYYCIAFQPYVGPWVGGQPVLFNAYSLSEVTAMLQAAASPSQYTLTGETPKYAP